LLLILSPCVQKWLFRPVSLSLGGHFGKKITNTLLEVADNKPLGKVDQKLAQIEYARQACKLADKICSFRFILFPHQHAGF
jgi:hypothetical protein